MKNNVALAQKPSILPPHPTITQVLTPIPLGFKMAYQQLQSPTAYGNQIAAYKIYKNTSANSFSGSTLWETRPHDNALGQRSVTLQDSSAGGGQQWYYFVTSVDTTGQESLAAAFQAGAVTSANANPNIASPTPTTVAPTTTSNAYAVIPEMTATFTSKGNKVLLVFYATLTINANGQGAFVAFFRDGVQQSGDIQWEEVTSGVFVLVSCSFIDSPSAGSHTWDMRWKLQNAGATMTAVALIRGFQVVELG